MTLGDRLALTHPWWMWSHPSIVEAIAKVHLQHWLPEYHAKLCENEKSGRSPTHKELAGDLYLCRNPRNVERMATDSRQLTGQTLLGLSFSLEIPIAGFFPTWPAWIAGAAFRLISDGKSQAEPCIQGLLAYALYRQRRPVVRQIEELALEMKIVEEVFRAQEGAFAATKQTEEAILKAIRLLGPVLEACINK